mmetsp:Transcript_31937/g.101491  ORF Transcript_31937/g.101491 Transcript_31937/m.101491 type:complete len:560 (+) Transcript_31937:89-1768(+)
MMLSLGHAVLAMLHVICCAMCAMVEIAREIRGGQSYMLDAMHIRLLRWATTSAAVSLLVQLALSLLGLEEAFGTEYKANEENELTWREDEGKTKLVPLLPQSKDNKKDGPTKKFTMEEVAKHNKKDDLWMIVDGMAYDVTRYVDKHPGGALPMENMAGKDCTDVFANYHAAKVYKNMLPAYYIGEVSDYKVYPHVADFRRVRQELLRRGLFETDMRFYWKMASWHALLFFGALYMSLGGASTAARMGGAAVMGIFWQQLAGIGHDVGHSAVTHVFWLDHLIGSTLASLMGLSTCWWKRNHNTHHVVCNSVENDPDIQHMPLIAVTPRVFAKPYWSTYYTKWVSMDGAAKFLVGNQHFIFYPMMAVARFNLYVQSWILLLSSERMLYRKVEICAMLVYCSWVVKLATSMPTWLEMLGWLLTSHAVAGILHVQIVISHWAMETYHGHAYNDETDDWYITQLKTTMNVDTHPMLDFVHIGLQFQIEHHLYPRLPRHNLRKARELVQEVCKKHDIHYHEPGFFQANIETMQALYRTALNAKESQKGSHGFYESAIWDGMKLAG